VYKGRVSNPPFLFFNHEIHERHEKITSREDAKPRRSDPLSRLRERGGGEGVGARFIALFLFPREAAKKGKPPFVKGVSAEGGRGFAPSPACRERSGWGDAGEKKAIRPALPKSSFLRKQTPTLATAT